MAPLHEHDLDDEFSIFPFRRTVVDSLARDEIAPTPVGQPTQEIRYRAAARRSSPWRTLGLAAPVALLAFVATLAGAAVLERSPAASTALVATASAAPAVERSGARPGPAHAAPRQRAPRTSKPRPHLRAKPERTVPRPPTAPLPPAAPPTPVVRRLLVAGVVGLPLARAVRTLRATGAEPNVYPVPSSAAPGTVVAQHPRPGTRARAGDHVRVNVSAGRR